MSTEHFREFAAAVRSRFAEMTSEKLFVVAADRDEVWARYLGAFAPGTDPLFRKRTEHDCSCCRAFIRSVGNVVAIQNGTLSSVWDLSAVPGPYQAVADAMADYAKGLAITDVFLTPDSHHGVTRNREQTESGAVITHDHFSVDVPRGFVASDCATRRGDARTAHQMLVRAASELTSEAASTVLDLIGQGSLYRGEEHRRAVEEFVRVQASLAGRADSDLIAWTLVDSSATRFRNTVIGTLVQDLSEGVDLERAVRAYESKVAPQNYRRPTALITKKMVEDAMKTIRELDLEDALQRRHARLADVSVESVLFVDNAVRGRMKGGIETALMEEVRPVPFDAKTAEPIGIDAFIADVLPKCTSLQVWLDNAKAGNFVSMTAPVHADTGGLFRWANDFAWSYEGNVADSIKERVKRAGGRVEGVSLRTSLAWYNYDDLDIHVREPSGNEIAFFNKCDKLDVDMNAGAGKTREPVENVRWVGELRGGVYTVWVNQYCRRESTNVGFEIEIEYDGGLEHFRYENAVRSQANVPVAEITVRGGRVAAVRPSEHVIGGSAAREVWGLETQRLVRVNALVLSPNHWAGQTEGNKHWFFILDGCKNPLPTRGIYNEFLSPRMAKHRKVFEVLGDKTKCPPANEQLSGIGFSSTKRDKVAIVAAGPRMNRLYNIEF